MSKELQKKEANSRWDTYLDELYESLKDNPDFKNPDYNEKFRKVMTLMISKSNNSNVFMTNEKTGNMFHSDKEQDFYMEASRIINIGNDYKDESTKPKEYMVKLMNIFNETIKSIYDWDCEIKGEYKEKTKYGELSKYGQNLIKDHIICINYIKYDECPFVRDTWGIRFTLFKRKETTKKHTKLNIIVMKCMYNVYNAEWEKDRLIWISHIKDKGSFFGLLPKDIVHYILFHFVREYVVELKAIQ